MATSNDRRLDALGTRVIRNGSSTEGYSADEDGDGSDDESSEDEDGSDGESDGRIVLFDRRETPLFRIPQRAHALVTWDPGHTEDSDGETTDDSDGEDSDEETQVDAAEVAEALDAFEVLSAVEAIENMENGEVANRPEERRGVAVEVRSFPFFFFCFLLFSSRLKP